MFEEISELNKVIEFINKYEMIKERDSVIVGISGGADSVCLLDMLWRISKTKEINIVAVHIHHGIRGEEADRDERFAEKICREREIRFRSFRLNVPEYAKVNRLSEEEAGRKLRYETFRKCAYDESGSEIWDNTCNGTTERINCERTLVKIAVAHNLNDSVETFMHNLCRGTGQAGLTGIKPVNGDIIRPILCLGRHEIEHYLKENNIDYMNDSTNYEEEYTRNKIRLNVLPYLAEHINERAQEHIYEACLDIALTEEYVNRQAQSAYHNLCKEDNNGIYVDKNAFKDIEKCLQPRIVRLALEKLAGKLKDITRRHISDVIELCDRQSGKYIMLPYGIIVRVNQQSLIFERKTDKAAGKSTENAYKKPKETETKKETGNVHKKPIETGNPYKKPIEVRIGNDTGDTISTYRFGSYIFEIQLIDCLKNKINMKNLENSLKFEQKLYTKYFDYDKIKNTVSIRTRNSGDYLTVNSSGGTKKLKSYFIEEKIPAEARESIPLLADGSHIMWVYGHRISEYYKITEHTQKIIRIIGRKCEDGRQD